MTSGVAEIEASIREHRAALDALAGMAGEIAAFARSWYDVLRAGGTVYFCGNGGSAGDSQHLAAELTGRFEGERRGLRAVALTTDTSALTAIANDYSYDRVFARQVDALARPGDLLVAISTSGNAASVLNAAQAMQRAGGRALGLTGASGGKLHADGVPCLRVPSPRTARIQELHILIGHCCCQLIDGWVAQEPS